MSDFDEAALLPRVGDEIVLPGGLISYKVTMVVIPFDPPPNDDSCMMVSVRRHELRRQKDKPTLDLSSRATLPAIAWYDLVRFACSVRRGPEPEVPLR